MQGTRIRSLVRELRSHMLRGAAEKEKKKSDSVASQVADKMYKYVLEVFVDKFQKVNESLEWFQKSV